VAAAIKSADVETLRSRLLPLLDSPYSAAMLGAVFPEELFPEAGPSLPSPVPAAAPEPALQGIPPPSPKPAPAKKQRKSTTGIDALPPVPSPTAPAPAPPSPAKKVMPAPAIAPAAMPILPKKVGTPLPTATPRYLTAETPGADPLDALPFLRDPGVSLSNADKDLIRDFLKGKFCELFLFVFLFIATILNVCYFFLSAGSTQTRTITLSSVLTPEPDAKPPLSKWIRETVEFEMHFEKGLWKRSCKRRRGIPRADAEEMGVQMVH
jgi:hypothetical protein